MYSLYLYFTRCSKLLCSSMGGIYYKIIWLHYKAISEKHCPTRTIPNTSADSNQTMPYHLY